MVTIAQRRSRDVVMSKVAGVSAHQSRSCTKNKYLVRTLQHCSCTTLFNNLQLKIIHVNFRPISSSFSLLTGKLVEIDWYCLLLVVICFYIVM